MQHLAYVVVFVIRPKDGDYQLLLAKRAEGRYMGGTWQLIAGRIDAGETAWQAALRELHEETGLRPVEFYRLSRVFNFYRYENDSLNTAVPFCVLVDDGAVVSLNDEHTDFSWVDLDRAAHLLMWPGDKEALAEVRRVILNDDPAKEYLRIPLTDKN